jgi:hypothetical protein
MTPEEEFEQGQREGRARARRKSFLWLTSWVSASIVFCGILVPLVMLEVSVIAALPFLRLLGRAVFFLFAMIAASAAGVVWRFAGGAKLKEIEAWERKRDDW